MSTKTGSLRGHYKSCIKSIDEDNSLKLGTDRDRIPHFAIRISHNFTFVLRAAIDLTRKYLPSVEQFFESLYTLSCRSPYHAKFLHQDEHMASEGANVSILDSVGRNNVSQTQALGTPSTRSSIYCGR